MIRFEEDSRGLFLEYEVEFNDPEWVSKRLKQDGEDGEVTVSCGFTFEAADLLKYSSKRGADNSNVGCFGFASRQKTPAIIGFRAAIFGCDRDNADRDPRHPSGLECKTFVAERNIEVFTRIEKVMTGPGEIGRRRCAYAAMAPFAAISSGPKLSSAKPSHNCCNHETAVKNRLSVECNQIAELGRLHD